MNLEKSYNYCNTQRPNDNRNPSKVEKVQEKTKRELGKALNAKK